MKSSVTVEAARERHSDRVIVSLGDSYSSGEGMPPFYGEDDQSSNGRAYEDRTAHRSITAWSGMLTLPGLTGTMSDYRYGEAKDVHWYFAACTGAETKHLYEEQEIGDGDPLPPQFSIFDALGEKKADYVTVSIGGNDLDFTGIVEGMLLNYFNYGVLDGRLKEAEEKIKHGGSVRTRLKKAYKEIAMHAGEQATVLVVGYPELFAVNVSTSIFDNLCIDFYEAYRVNSDVVLFNHVIQEVIEECNTESPSLKILFVPAYDEDPDTQRILDSDEPYSTFAGHGAYSDEPYINGLKLPICYSIHPNLDGARTYANRVQKVINELERTERERDIREMVGESDLSKEYYSPSPDMAKDWQIAYVEKIKQAIIDGYWVVDETEGANTWFIYDIDQSGIPELFIRYGFGRMHYIVIMYSFESGNICEVGDITSSLYATYYDIPEKGMLTHYGVQGVAGADIITLESGEIKEVNIFSEDAYGRDYTPLEEIYPGAKELDEHSVWYVLPMFVGEKAVPTAPVKISDDEIKIRMEAVVQTNEVVYWADVHDYTGTDVGKRRFAELLEYGAINEGVRYKIEKSGWGDLNADGQLECLLELKNMDGDYYNVQLVMSLQNGKIYVYPVPNYSGLIIKGGKIYDENLSDYVGNGKPSKYFRFYKEQYDALWSFVVG